MNGDVPRPSILLDLTAHDLVRLYTAADAAPVRIVGAELPYRLMSELDRRSHTETAAAWAAYRDGDDTEPAAPGRTGFEALKTRDLVRLSAAMRRGDRGRDPRMAGTWKRLDEERARRDPAEVDAEQQALKEAEIRLAVEVEDDGVTDTTL